MPVLVVLLLKAGGVRQKCAAIEHMVKKQSSITQLEIT